VINCVVKVAVVGNYSSGKTTFLNAILGTGTTRHAVSFPQKSLLIIFGITFRPVSGVA
jgi:hypothetical protein